MTQACSLPRARVAWTAFGVSALLVAWPMAVGAGAVDTAPSSTTPTSTPAATGATGRVPVSARSYSFTPSKLTIASGQRVTIALKSTDVPHDFVVNGPGLSNKKVVTVKGGKTATGKLVLPRQGKYQFYCSIPGHRAAGMRGTITAT